MSLNFSLDPIFSLKFPLFLKNSQISFKSRQTTFNLDFLRNYHSYRKTLYYKTCSPENFLSKTLPITPNSPTPTPTIKKKLNYLFFYFSLSAIRKEISIIIKSTHSSKPQTEISTWSVGTRSFNSITITITITRGPTPGNQWTQKQNRTLTAKNKAFFFFKLNFFKS